MHPVISNVSAMDDIIKKFDAAIEGIAVHAHPLPTEKSVSKIEEHFKIKLPKLLLQLAEHGKNFSSRFLSLGSDFESHSHIIRVNSYWRRRRRTKRVPENLVVLTQGWMDNRFWCLDCSAPDEHKSDYAIQFWCPEKIFYASESDRPPERYPDFRSFVEADIYWADARNAG